jgi:DNA repair ATPase RecN
MDSTNINSNTNFNHNHNNNNPDLKMKQVEQELKRKKRELEKKKKDLEKNMTENHHLETICSDYKNYFDNIIEQKKKELDALTNLNEYVSKIGLNDKTSKYDRKEIEKEIDFLKKELNKYVSAN